METTDEVVARAIVQTRIDDALVDVVLANIAGVSRRAPAFVPVDLVDTREYERVSHASLVPC